MACVWVARFLFAVAFLIFAADALFSMTHEPSADEERECWRRR